MKKLERLFNEYSFIYEIIANSKNIVCILIKFAERKKNVKKG
jgi:hypothetical protein